MTIQALLVTAITASLGHYNPAIPLIVAPQPVYVLHSTPLDVAGTLYEPTINGISIGE
jgi:hypothetical protein